MKTIKIKNIIKLVSYTLFMVFITLASCSSEDGMDGIDGIDGINGTNGADGVDGTNGTNGEDGVDGQDGADGVDGTNGTNGEDGVDGQDGADGVDGTNGADGEDGVDGQDGADGEDGQDGNANVISSGWIDYDEDLWTDAFIEFGVEQREYPVEIADLTKDMVDTAVILMYQKFANAATGVYQMPFTLGITSVIELQEVSFLLRRNGGGLEIRINNVSAVGDPGIIGRFEDYRYVIIPAPVSAKGKSFSAEDTRKYYENEGVDFSNYESVTTYFNLKYSL